VPPAGLLYWASVVGGRTRITLCVGVLALLLPVQAQAASGRVRVLNAGTSGTVSLLVDDHSLSASAFVVRRPDENQEAFYRRLLQRNVKLPGIAFALDTEGDVYLVGRLPAEGVTPDGVDRLLGAILATSDGMFNELLTLGFLESMRREWRWRVERGESTRNLEAFRHLLEES